jgi:hypothetical protein
LEDGHDALLIDAFSVVQIKDAVLRLYESADLRERLAASGPAVVASLTSGDIALPYQAGIEDLLTTLSPHP